jgi:hypothetical protein
MAAHTSCQESTPVYIPPLTYSENKKIRKKSKWIFWITRQLFPIILVQCPHSDPLWNIHCMSNKKIISCFQYPVKTTVFTVSRKSFHTGCSNLTSMFLYVVIFQHMMCFFAAKTSPNMIGLTVKNIIIKKQLKFLFKVPGVLLGTIFEDCLNADWLVYWCAPLIEPQILSTAKTWLFSDTLLSYK